MKNLKEIKGFLLDMDGTFYLGEHLLPGALQFLELLDSRGLPFSFLTNNSSLSNSAYIQKLIGIGVPQKDAKVFTSGDATIHFLRREHSGQRICLIGTHSLEQDFRRAGIQLDDINPEVIVLGYDTESTYEKLCRLCSFVRGGLPYYATHPDINCPTPEGLMPDIGAMMALVESSTGRKADKIFGKPDRNLVDQVAEKLGVKLDELVMVGDRLYTDIAMGRTAGITTVLVLTGETSRKDLVDSPYQPDYICEDLIDLIRLLD